MIVIRSYIPFLLCILLHQHVHAQEKPDTSFNKNPDNLSLRSKDTDGDGVNDAEDKCINEKGIAKNSGCPEINIDKSRMFTELMAVFFETGSTSLSPGAIKLLNRLVQLLKPNPEMSVELAGYTDSIGNYDANVKLSLARSATAAAYLVKAGIDKSRIRTKGFGPDNALAENKTEKGRARNRRVELFLFLTNND